MNPKTFAAITVLAILNFIVLAVVQTYYNMQDLAYYENIVSEAQQKVDRLSAQGYAHFIIPEVYGEEDYNKDGILQYENWDGKIIDETQHQFRMQVCIQMAFKENLIDVNIPCSSVVLTSDGESMINNYVAQKFLSGDLSFSN
jgi:hypothetical protein